MCNLYNITTNQQAIIDFTRALLPGAVAVTPVPAIGVSINPAFANHAYVVLDDGRILIIEPRHLAIVAIFD